MHSPDSPESPYRARPETAIEPSHYCPGCFHAAHQGRCGECHRFCLHGRYGLGEGSVALAAALTWFAGVALASWHGLEQMATVLGLLYYGAIAALIGLGIVRTIARFVRSHSHSDPPVRISLDGDTDRAGLQAFDASETVLKETVTHRASR